MCEKRGTKPNKIFMMIAGLCLLWTVKNKSCSGGEGFCHLSVDFITVTNRLCSKLLG